MFYMYMPWMCFVAKFGLAMAFLNSYYASFTEEHIFPIERRATAIGICNFCARGITGFAPMVNEMANPVPIVSIICILFIGFINNFFLITEAEKNDSGKSIDLQSDHKAETTEQLDK